MMLQDENKTAVPNRLWSLSLDTWAVLLAMTAALAVRLGILRHIPW
jgi:hypothetical protein